MPRWVTRLHAWAYRRSGGRFLGRMGGQPVLLLQTTGRRSGRTRTTPVQFLADDDRFVVVASNAGAARPRPGTSTCAPTHTPGFGSVRAASSFGRRRRLDRSARSSGSG
jgi:F420H(2)-dependent quinone reductase